MLEAKETETNPSGLGVFIFSFLPIKQLFTFFQHLNFQEVI